MRQIAVKKKKPELRSENPDPIDVHVGSRLRMRRNLAGVSQEQLGKSLGLTFQQIQKYERGINRMGSSRLFQIAKILSVPVAYFFDDMPANMGLELHDISESPKAPASITSLVDKSDYDVLRRRETVELVRAYYRIADVKKRRKVYELIRSMSEEE